VAAAEAEEALRRADENDDEDGGDETEPEGNEGMACEGLKAPESDHQDDTEEDENNVESHLTWRRQRKRKQH
jgi:hypothetical protein